jgi:hypothetical protein
VSYAPRNAIFTGIDVTAVVAVRRNVIAQPVGFLWLRRRIIESICDDVRLQN